MSRKPTVIWFEGLAKSLPRVKKPVEPVKDKDGNISALDWLRIRYENTEFWEGNEAILEAKIAFETAKIVTGEAEAKVSKRNAENASKPRPNGQHP